MVSSVLFTSLGDASKALAQTDENFQIFPDSLNVSFNPQDPQLNSAVSVTAALKDSARATAPTNLSVTLDVLAPPVGRGSCDPASSGADVACVSIFRADFGTDQTSVSTTFPLRELEFGSAGPKTVYVSLFYFTLQGSGVGAGGSAFSGSYYFSKQTINVQPAANGANGNLSIVPRGDTVTTSGLDRLFAVVYTPPSGVSVGGYRYDCGNGTTGNATAADATFKCSYPYKQGVSDNYSVSVQPVDASGNSIGQAAQITSTVTGNEAINGAGNSVSNTGSDIGNGLFAFLAKVIGFLIGIINEFVFLMFWTLVVPIIKAMLSIRTYTDAFSNVIYPGWEVLRNLANIFFIVSLIFIALATLFRMESYNYKHLLVNVILAALLVNFSLVIGQAILGVADTIQNQFLPNNTIVIERLGQKLMVEQYRKTIYDQTLSDTAKFGPTSTVVKMMFLAMLAIGAFVTFAALAVFLLIRIVMLWILLMLSPVPYFASVLPFTKQFTGQWWSYFVRYAFFTPIMAFFLNMTAIIVENYDNVAASIINPSLQSGSTGVGGIADFAVGVASNILLLVFLVVSIKVADQFGIVGASVATKAVQGGLALPWVGAGFLGGRALGYAGRRYNEATVRHIRGEDEKVPTLRKIGFAIANPLATYKAYQKRSEELSHEASGKAEAAGLEIVEQALTGNTKILPRVQAFEKHAEDEFLKVFGGMSKEEVYKRARDVVRMKDNDEGRAAKRAIIKVALAEGYLDDIIQDGTAGPEGEDLLKRMQNVSDPALRISDVNGADFYDDGKGGRKLRYNDKTMRSLLLSFFKEDDQAAWRMINNDGETYGKKNDHYEYLGLANFDPKTGHHTIEKNDNEGEQYAADELSKKDSRSQARVAPHALMNLDDSGTIKERAFKVFAVAATENSGFMQERTIRYLLTMGKQYKEFIDEQTKSLKNLAESDITRIKKMEELSSEAAAAVYLRATKQSKINATDFVNNNEGIPYIKSDGTRDFIKFTKKQEKGNVVQNIVNNPVYKVSDTNKDKVINKFETTAPDKGPIPDYSDLVKAIESTLGNRGDSVKMVGEYIGKIADNKVKKMDVQSIINSTQAVQNVAVKLAPQELEKLGDVMASALKRGLVNASKYSTTDDSARIAEISKVMSEELKKSAKEFSVKDVDNKIGPAGIKELVEKAYNLTK